MLFSCSKCSRNNAFTGGNGSGAGLVILGIRLIELNANTGMYRAQ